MSRRDRPKKKSASPKREPVRASGEGSGEDSERVEDGTRESSEGESRIERATYRGPSGARAWLDDVLVVVAAVLTFARGVPNDLVRGWDDGRFLVDFAPVQSISGESLGAIFRAPHFEAYHPLHLLSYWLDVPFAGPHGPTLHATSLALFAGALLLVRRVFRGLGLGRVAALVATLAYGLHPAQVEAVAWATGRKEIVALLFASGAILLHLQSTSPFSAAAWGSRVLYVLAALAKTTVLPLPIVLIAIDVFLRPRSSSSASETGAVRSQTSPEPDSKRVSTKSTKAPSKVVADPHQTTRDEDAFGARLRRALFAQLPTLAIGGAFAVLVLSIWEASEMVRPRLEGFGAVSLVASTFTHHLGHALAPFGSSPVYPIHRDVSAFGALDFAGPVVLLLALLVPSGRARFALLSFVALLLPVSNLVPLYFEVQDRYLSLPLLPLAFGLGALVEAGAVRRISFARIGLALAYVALLATLSYRYTTVWAHDGTLWRHATRAQPEADYAWIKLGETLRDEALALEGDEARLTFDRSIHAYERAIRIAPTLVLPHVARVRAMAHRDELVHTISPSRAAELANRFGRAQADPDALKELASEMLELGYRDAALVPLGRALDLEPLAPERLEHAARVQLESGQEWLARFYVSRLPGPPIDPALAALR